ncbi:hypothetical protein AVEN_123973-1 [Araneus ventricosus]|uniref:Uncharacterized protein n=1 Tax=Araneus ventricosus TaxID=182803 RepID=A0A4Y2DBV2_ARAVE|nr:hypothetical protein AVEN_123973-1 [Araneus ventricosus]
MTKTHQPAISLQTFAPHQRDGVGCSVHKAYMPNTLRILFGIGLGTGILHPQNRDLTTRPSRLPEAVERIIINKRNSYCDGKEYIEA